MSKADRPDQPGAAERFNEDQATYTVRGAGKPDLEAGVAAIRAVWKTLPSRPGVYRMQDARGDVLYVGKARTLKSRVTSYTQVARLPKRLHRLYERVSTEVARGVEEGRANLGVYRDAVEFSSAPAPFRVALSARSSGDDRPRSGLTCLIFRQMLCCAHRTSPS